MSIRAHALSCYESTPSWKKSVSMSVRYLPHFQTVILHISRAQPSVPTASCLISTSPAALQIQLIRITNDPQISNVQFPKCSIPNSSTTHWLTHLSARPASYYRAGPGNNKHPTRHLQYADLKIPFPQSGPKKLNLKFIHFSSPAKFLNFLP